MRFRHPLEQYRAAAVADQAAHPVAQDAVLLKGDDPFAVLPGRRCRSSDSVGWAVGLCSCVSLLVSNTPYHRNRK